MQWLKKMVVPEEGVRAVFLKHVFRSFRKGEMDVLRLAKLQYVDNETRQSNSLGKHIFFGPVSPPAHFEGAKIAFFWTGDL